MEQQVKCVSFGLLPKDSFISVAKDPFYKEDKQRIDAATKIIMKFCEDLSGSVGQSLHREEFIFIQENRSIYEYGIRAVQVMKFEEKKQQLSAMDERSENSEFKRKKIESPAPWLVEYIGKNVKPSYRNDNVGNMMYKFRTVQVNENPLEFIESLGYSNTFSYQAYYFSSNMDVEIWAYMFREDLLFEIVGLQESEIAGNSGQEIVVEALKSKGVLFERKVNDKGLKLEGFIA